MHLYEVLKRPLTTEKSTRLKDDYRQYAFEVDLRANKKEVKSAVELAFPNIQVLDVTVLRMPRKRRHYGRRVLYTSIWKKAIIRIPANQRIDLFEGV